MKPIFDPEHLLNLAKKRNEDYKQAKPFPFIVFDDFIDASYLEKALFAFPSPADLDFYSYNNPLERKLAFDRIEFLPDPIKSILIALNSAVFLQFLEGLTGIQGLLADPYYRGGGIHQIRRDGKLDIHIDFNYYKKLKLIRKLNVLLYLNQGWQESYGGYLELWSGKQVENSHIINRCEHKVLPVFNRMVVFSTSETSYHGHPEPLTCPEGVTRKSIATYYYVAPTVDETSNSPHSTIFIKRPQDDDVLDTLRAKRSQGRLSS